MKAVENAGRNLYNVNKYSFFREVKAVDKKYCPYCMTPVGDDGVCPNCGLTSGTYTPLPHHIPPGTVLMGRYLVGRVLGEGGFGITYIGCDLRLELKVAIKEYFPTNWVARHSDVSLSVSNYAGAEGSYAKGKSRFLYEARTMAKMDKQPEIVSVRDFFELNNTAYIVMEYVDGTTFKELVAQRGGRLPAGELLHLIEPLFSALSAVHAAGLIHRDISPDNLMLERGSVRLLDFGCARESTQGDETMTITLKHGFAPIEQYQHKGQGPWTDVYGLSATIYYCLTGKTPPQALDRLMDDEIILPRRLGVDLTEKQEMALLRGMGIKQHQRFRSVEELHTALYEGGDVPAAPEPVHEPEPEPLQRDESEPETPTDHVESSARGGSSRRRAVLGVVLSLVAVAGILGLIFLPQGGEVEPNVSGVGGIVSSDVPTEWDVPERDELFANAQSAADEDTLAELLADEGVEAVSLSGDFHASRPLTINKPLLVPEDASAVFTCSVELAEGGVLWANGLVDGSIVVSGGTVVADAGGEVYGSLVLLGSGGLVRQGGAVGEDIYMLPLEELFSGAETVTSEDDLRAACESGSVSAIRVEGDIVISESMTAKVPVLVAEGARLASQVSGLEFRVEGAPLVNDGTVECSLQLGGESPLLLNRGELRQPDGIWLGGSESSNCAFINLGSAELGSYNAMWCRLLNYGSLTASGSAEEPGTLGFDSGDFSNFGSVSVGENCVLVSGGFIDNHGAITIGGALENYGSVSSVFGSIELLPGGSAENRGLIDMYDVGTLTVNEGALLRTVDGVLLYRSNCSQINGEIDGRVWEVSFELIDDVPMHSVTTEAELLDALADESIRSVVINGDLTLTQPLTVTKPVYVFYDSSLTIPEGGALTVDGSILVVNGRMVCDGIDVVNGGMLEVIGEWTAHNSGGAGLNLSGGSWAYSRMCGMSVSELSLSEGSMAVYASDEISMLRSIALSGGSFLVLNGETLRSDDLEAAVSDSTVIQLCDAELGSSASIVLSRTSLYSQCGWLTLLDGGEMNVQSGARLASFGGRLVLEHGSELLNGGSFSVLGFSDTYRDVVNGSLENRGSMFLTQPINVSGTLTNKGRIYSAIVPAAGTFSISSGAVVEGIDNIESWPEG